MRKILLILLLTFTGLAVYAEPQRHGHKKPTTEQTKEFKEFKMKYLAQEMQLKEDQRDRFFELYDAMMKEKRQAFAKVHSLEKKLRSGKELSDEEYAEISNARNSARSAELAIDQKYEREFEKFLTKKQIFLFKEAEGRFRDKMREMKGPGKGKK